MNKRQCGTCTKCCEGHLTGDALGHTFYRGKPCHFIAIGKGCTVYAKRPKEPCQSYKCSWLKNEDIPEWMKPNEINAIISEKEINKIKYFELVEAGETLRSRVLTWVIEYCMSNQINLVWRVEGGDHWIGNQEFVTAIRELKKS
jgi:hypothetical protein